MEGTWASLVEKPHQTVRLPHADYLGDGYGSRPKCARSSFVRLVDGELLLVVHLPFSDDRGGNLAIFTTVGSDSADNDSSCTMPNTTAEVPDQAFHQPKGLGLTCVNTAWVPALGLRRAGRGWEAHLGYDVVEDSCRGFSYQSDSRGC